MKSRTIRHGVAWAVVLGLAVTSTWEAAQASGFAIREQSTSAQGTSFASAPTGIEDISYSFFNPASLAFQEGHHTLVNVSYILPSAEFQDGQASTVLTTPINTNSRFDGDDDLGKAAVVPSLYAMVSLTDDIKVGASVNAPFGLETENSDGWIGRYHGLDSALRVIDISFPTAAWRPVPGLALGGGFRILHADARLTNAVDEGTLATSLGLPGGPFTPGGEDGFADLQGEDWGWGGHAGLMVDFGAFVPALDGLRFGAAYRSHVDFNIDGDTNFTSSGTAAGNSIQSFTQLNRDTGATADLDLPETVTFGLHYDITNEFAVMGQAEWTNWSRFDELVVDFDNNAQPNSVTEESWNDTWFFSVGTIYKPDWLEGLTLRLGGALDQSPVPDSTRTPRIPDEDRYWISAGAGYEPWPWLSFDFAYTHIFVPDADVDLRASDEGNTFRGNLSGTYAANIDIFSVQARLRF